MIKIKMDIMGSGESNPFDAKIEIEMDVETLKFFRQYSKDTFDAICNTVQHSCGEASRQIQLSI